MFFHAWSEDRADGDALAGQVVGDEHDGHHPRDEIPPARHGDGSGEIQNFKLLVLLCV